MVALKKSKTIKKVTEIPNASVTIEVEETEDKAEKISTAASQATENPEENSETLSDPESSGGFSWKKIFLIILIVVPIGFLLFGGFLFFSQNFNPGFLKQEPKKTLTLPEIKPTPTEVSVDKQAYEIEVRNGSGIAGEGARVKEILEKAGFKVGTVGNAGKSDYTDTIITVNSDVKEGYIGELTRILEERGPVGKVEKFATGQDGEVLIILGSSLTSPTPTP